MLFIWLGGCLLLYIDLQEPVRIVSEYWKNNSQPAHFDVFEWIQGFARPLFVFGVMCAVAMPKLDSKKKKAKKSKKSAKPADKKKDSRSTAKPSS